VAIVDLLIKAGAEVNAPGSDGETPLMKVLEIASGDPTKGEIVQKLVNAGANPRLWYARGKLPAHIDPGSEKDGLPSFSDVKS
jgi:ankyrin repeat protein